jgi:DNA-directed RNA polymerase subunit K/omega
MTTKVVEDYKDILKSYDPSKNITKNILSKYEKCKIIGFRMEQLARNARPYVEIEKNEAFDPHKVALKELEARVLPYMICRTLANGKKEYYRLDDMIIL